MVDVKPVRAEAKDTAVQRAVAEGPCVRQSTSDLIADGKLAIGDGYRAKNSELGSEGLPFARARNINEGFHFADADRFPDGDLERVGDKVSQPGDVAFTSKGTVGRLAFVRTTTPRFVYAPQLCFWRSLDHEVLDPRWLYLADYVSLGDQRKMEISLRPIAEQRAIARVLGALDDRIELNRRMSETLEEMARALFRSWFVDFDPVRAKAEGQPSGLPPDLDALFPASFEASELGEIPAGWEVRSLDEIATFTNGLALQRFPPESDKWLPVIKIAEIRRGYTEKTGKASTSIDQRYIVDDGDLLFSWSGSLEIVLWARGRGALNQHLFKVTSDEFPRWFCWGWTREHLDDFRGIAAGKATTMGHIQRHHLTGAKVAVPPADVVQAGAHIAALVEQHVRHAVGVRTLGEQREALLPCLVSGELRIAEYRGATE